MKTFYGQFEPPVDKFIFDRYFPDEDIKGVFVECGAFDGETESTCKYFEESMNWSGINIEPVPWIYEKLVINRPNSVNLNYALSNIPGEATFQAIDHPEFGVNCTNGSLDHTENHKYYLEESGCDFIPVKVLKKTWEQVVGEQQLNHVDLFVLDVEGHELSVIDGMAKSKVLPDVICIEVGHIGIDEIRKKLDGLNYTYDISSHVNAFFIKNEKLPLFALRASAVRLNSIDLIEENKKLGARISKCEHHNGYLLDENHRLKMHINELDQLYNEIVKSRAWKLIEKIRSLKTR